MRMVLTSTEISELTKELEDAKKQLQILRNRLAHKFSCCECGDGNTPLYCLNCAERCASNHG